MFVSAWEEDDAGVEKNVDGNFYLCLLYLLLLSNDNVEDCKI